MNTFNYNEYSKLGQIVQKYPRKEKNTLIMGQELKIIENKDISKLSTLEVTFLNLPTLSKNIF